MNYNIHTNKMGKQVTWDKRYFKQLINLCSGFTGRRLNAYCPPRLHVLCCTDRPNSVAKLTSILLPSSSTPLCNCTLWFIAEINQA